MMKTKLLKYFCIVGISLTVMLSSANWVLAQDGEKDKTLITPNGRVIKRIISNSPPNPSYGIRSTTSNLDIINSTATVQLAVPFSDWSFGSAPTAAAMIAGYYDRNGYANIYTGQTNGGVYPETNAFWDYWQDASGRWIALNPLSATKNGLDGRTERGHVDDYWESEGTGGIDYHDPWHQNSWVEHTYEDAVSDFMYSNQWDNGYENQDGATAFYIWDEILNCDNLEVWADNDNDPRWLVDGTLGFRNFYQSRGYTVTDCYSQQTDNQYVGGFSFIDYKEEIDAGYPVMIHLYQHTIVGTGYDDTVSPPAVYLNDPWFDSTQIMYWGEEYNGAEMLGVSIVRLLPHPENDEIEGAIEINIGNTIEFDASSATHANDDPPITNCGIGEGDATVWYQYTANISSPSAITLNTKGSDYDTFIAVWIGDGEPSLLEPIACSVASAGNFPSVAFKVLNGTTYYIEVGSLN